MGIQMLEDLIHDNWLEYLPYVVIAVIVVLIWKLQTLCRLQKTSGNNGYQSASGDMLNNSL